jgi:GDP-L-fucose synthase
MDSNQKKAVFVAGHRGMVGSALVRRLEREANVRILTAGRDELDLLDQAAVFDFFARHRIEEVYLAAARVGGIHANDTYPAEFIYENLAIECNVIHAAHRNDVPRLLFLGSSCIYPKFADQPIREEALLTGALEPTNEPYAIAKIAGLKLCESYNRQYGRDYRSVMPTNLYGPNDNYHPENSHVIPALLRRFHDAKLASAPEVVVWGSGKPRREFLHVDDLARACLHLMNISASELRDSASGTVSHINVGCGEDHSIAEVGATIAKVTGYTGHLSFDTSRPDGTPRKLLDVSRITRLGWKPEIGLEDGLHDAYACFLKTLEPH